MNNRYRYRENIYCPNCGSNVESDQVEIGSSIVRCAECGHKHDVSEEIGFWVDVSKARPDPLDCCRCIHRGDSPFPWVEGNCKDLPFWLMNEDALAPIESALDNEYLNEIICTLYKQF